MPQISAGCHGPTTTEDTKDHEAEIYPRALVFFCALRDWLELLKCCRSTALSYNEFTMHKALLISMGAALLLAGCHKAGTTTASASSDAVQQKLQQIAGGNARDCGRIKSQAPDALQPASSCAMQAAAAKQPFYVAYDMPGLTVGVAGNSEGKLFSVQAEQPEKGQPAPKTEVASAPCPSSLRIAQSGRVTCMTPPVAGAGAMGENPHGGAMPPAGGDDPHGGMAAPPGTPNPHGATIPRTGAGQKPPSKD